MDWQTLFSLFQKLDEGNKKRLHNAISLHMGLHVPSLAAHLSALREARFAGGVSCPHCGGQQTKRNGTYRGRQRYLCRCCGRSFNDLTNSPMAGSWHLDKWMDYIQYMLEGFSCPRLARELGIHVSTAFYWRHKVLRAVRSLGDAAVSGIVEVDETFFLESQKGNPNLICRARRKSGGHASKPGVSKEQVAVLVALDRQGQAVSRTAGRGRLTVAQVERAIGGLIAPGATLVTDKAHSFVRFAANQGLAHRQVDPTRKIYRDGVYHIQHVNNYHSRLKQWMRRFNGVATKYLDHYLAWFKLLEQTKAVTAAGKREALLTTACRPWMRTTRRFFPMAEAA